MHPHPIPSKVISSLRKQSTFREATTGFPGKWHLSTERGNSIPMACHYTDLGSAFDWMKQLFNHSEAYPDLGTDVSSVENFCVLFLGRVISRGNQWWRREMLQAVFFRLRHL